MKIDHYRAIAVAINSLRYNPNLSDVEIQSYELALGEVRDYMSQQEAEKNEPLTLDDLRQMFGQPVWCEDGSGNFCWCLVAGFDSKNAFIGAVDHGADLWDGAFYGMSGDGTHGLHEMGWLAYRRPPKEAHNA